MKFTVIDFETTGAVAGYPNEPWQLGMVEVVGGEVRPETKWETLFHVGERPFSPHAVGRYAQMRHLLAAAAPLSELWPGISARLTGTALVAHNASTERSVLTAAAPLACFGPWVDTLKLARRLFPGLPSYALGDLVAAFGLGAQVDAICPGRTWHDALYDACACAVLAARFMSDGGLF